MLKLYLTAHLMSIIIKVNIGKIIQTKNGISNRYTVSFFKS